MDAYGRSPDHPRYNPEADPLHPSYDYWHRIGFDPRRELENLSISFSELDDAALLDVMMTPIETVEPVLYANSHLVRLVHLLWDYQERRNLESAK